MGPQEIELYKSIIVASLSFCLIMGGFLVWVINRHRKHVHLQRKFYQAEINAQEKERARMANDLHDELSPKLAAIKIGINHFSLAKEEDKVLLENTNHTLDALSADLRDISFNLMPATLQKKGLVEAVKELAGYINRTGQLTINLTLPSSFIVSSEYSIHLYRIVQEIIHNTLKHAKASELKLNLSIQSGKLVLLSKDNGVGFDISQKLEGEKGLGLQSIRGRVEIMNGFVEVESKLNQGAGYTILIPL